MELESEVKNGNVAEVTQAGDSFLAAADRLLADIREVRRLSSLIREAGCPWAYGLKKRILNGASENGAFGLLQNLGIELKQATVG